MDRISTLRNIEDALADFESGTTDLASVEQRVLAVLRTYATDFATDGLKPFRAVGDDRADGLVIVAESRRDARKRIRDMLDDDVTFELEIFK